MASNSVLLIEPDKVIGAIYVHALESKGYSVLHVLNAQDALVAADEAVPDLVICEIQLVGHSGIEFLYEFRSYADWQKIPVIILSSVPPIEFTGSSQGLTNDLAIDRYLYKPNTGISQLLREVSDVVNAHEPA